MCKGALSLLILLGVAFLATPANALDADKALTQYIHESWQIQNGLPQNSVQAIVQTRDGFLWLGTQEGLVRFDGARFTVYNTQNTQELRKHDVIALMETRDGALWIGTVGGGLVRYREGRFTRFGTQEGLASDFVRSLYQDSKDRIWIGTDLGGVSCYSEGRFRTFSTKDGVAANFVRAVFEDSLGNIWFGTDGAGVTRFDGKTFQTLTTADGLSNNFISVIREDRDGALLFGTFGGGMTRLQNGRFEIIDRAKGLSHNFVRSIHQDRNGTFWIGTDGGLSRWSARGWDHFSTQQGLTHDVIWSLLEDREGSLWIGTYNGGLNRLRDGNLTPFTSQEGLSTDSVSAVLEDRSGKIWIGTIGGGVNVLQNGRITAYGARDGLPNDFVRALHEDKRGAIWLGTNGGGLTRFQDGQFTSFSTRDGLSNDFVRSIYEDSAGNLWIGTNGGGLNRYKDGKFTVYSTKNGMPSDYIRPVLEDSQKRLWVATDGGGLIQFEGEKLTIYNTSNGLSNNSVLALYEDSDRTLWIGTLGGGLNWIRKGKLYNIGSRQGMYDDVVYQILEDSAGNLWMGCNKGIYKVSKEELLDYAAGRARLVNSVAYGISDGMKSAEVNGGSTPAGWKTRDGKLWFPTIKGIVMVDTSRFRKNLAYPPVLILAADINNTSYDPAAEAEVPPGPGRLKFEYTALSLAAPERVRFKIQLEGFERGWQDVGTERSALYTNIPPGRYRFRVKACNNDGVWNEVGASFGLRLKPHFYETYWFYGLCFVALVYVVSGVQRYRLNQLRGREEELSRMVKERTQDLLSAQQQLELSNQMLADANENLEQRVREGINKLREAERMAAYGSMVAGVAHEVRQPLFAIQAASYVLSDKLKDQSSVQKQLKTLDRESRRMAALMDDLLEFARPSSPQRTEAAPEYLIHEAVESFQASHPSHGLEIQTEITPSLPHVMADHGRILQIFANLLTNAMKHAKGATRILISADPVPLLPGEEKTKWIRIRVSDNGEGIPAEHLENIFEPFYTTGKGTGLGLAIVHRIVADHGGTTRVDSAPGEGTTFTIFLPTEQE